MKYTIADFKRDFPNDDVCLDYIFRTRFPDAKGYYRISTRMSYTHCKTGHQIYPLVGTIFQKSTTPLTLWFYAIYLFSVSKNGVSAKELERQLGVTYPTAWRIAKQIRLLMTTDGDKLSGIVEIDETHLGTKRILGAVERGGEVRASVVNSANGDTIGLHIENNVDTSAKLMSDCNPSYRQFDTRYDRESVNHSKKEYARGNVHVNTVDAFWNQVKSSIAGTHHFVSPKYLQSYVDFFSFQHSHRFSEAPLFWVLLGRAC